MRSLDIGEIGESGRLGLGRNLGLPQYNSNYFPKVLEDNASWGYFWYSVRGPPSHRCDMQPHLMCMRFDKVTDLDWVMFRGAAT